jgi:SAM-dependent methyltransferase
MPISTIHPWFVEGPIRSPFALPTGWSGALAARFMLWTGPQEEVLTYLDVQPNQRVLEVGYGPGGLIRLLEARTPASRIVGVDLSPDMQAAAARRNRRAVREQRVELHVASAANTGLPAESFDWVVSVHNVALWPELEPGLDEILRVTAKQGRVVLVWHGGQARTRLARRLRLPLDKLNRVRGALAARFDGLEEHDLRKVVLFRRRRPG